jgi:hypothetical protein
MSPVMNAGAVPKGTVMNFYGEKPNLLSRIVYWQIRSYQRRKYPNSPRTGAIHSMIHLGGGKYLSVESPKAKIVEPEIRPDHKYTFWKYQSVDRFTEAAWAAFDQTVNEMNGTPYDYGQLLDILLKQLFSDFIPHKLSIFDFSRRRKVCSVAVHACLLAAYKQTDRTVEGPLGRQYVEETCPADFENDDTFEEV